MSSPACKDRIHGPVGGFEVLTAHEDDREPREFTPCGHCFPHLNDADEIDLPGEDLVIGIGPQSTAIHRRERTGPVTSYAEQDGETSLASIIGQPDFGFDDLEKTGGDA